MTLVVVATQSAIPLHLRGSMPQQNIVVRESGWYGSRANFLTEAVLQIDCADNEKPFPLFARLAGFISGCTM
jgi:hypothetical protein